MFAEKFKTTIFSFVLAAAYFAGCFCVSASNRSVNSAQINTIDYQDTIFFDLSAASFTAGTVQFPVYFRSDDTIYAVDFAMKFNQQIIQYDTIIGLLPTLNANFFLNPADSTLRFTSYDLNPIGNYQYVAWIKFYTQSTSISSLDFSNMEAYLNGFACTYFFLEGVNAINTPNQKPVCIFPNPSSGLIRIEGAENAQLDIFDLQGSLLRTFGKSSLGVRSFDLSSLENGSYVLSLTDDQGLKNFRVVIAH